VDIGSAVGRDHGLTQEKLAALADYESSGAFGDVERAVLRYADALTATPVDVPDALWAELRRHFDDAQLVELTSALAWENYRARFNHALEVEAEGFSDGAVCVLPEASRRSA
jgi:4-carboxymuconolactone decarboxylase